MRSLRMPFSVSRIFRAGATKNIKLPEPSRDEWAPALFLKKSSQSRPIAWRFHQTLSREH
jgi:hypothetical protein